MCFPHRKRISSTATFQSVLRLLQHALKIFLPTAEIKRHCKMAYPRGDLLLNLRPARHFFFRSGNKKSQKVQDQGSLENETKFTVLVRKIFLFKHAPLSRCVIVKKYDTTHTSVLSNSVVKTVDLSKHLLSVVFPSGALLFTCLLLLLFCFDFFFFFSGRGLLRESA